jgi:hypothetical protein
LGWQLASPKWPFEDAVFDRSAKSFDNPDHVRDRRPQPFAGRLGLVKASLKMDDFLEKRLAQFPAIAHRYA